MAAPAQSGEPAVTTPDADLIALSALQHYLFCPRQCALIHVEQAWSENALTAEGRILHERTSEPGHEVRRGVKVATAMPLVSRKLGVSGIGDLVELHPTDDGGAAWQAVPVEYKRGKPKSHRADEVQLCAQGLALEEMLGRAVPTGLLYYGQTRRRVEVALDAGLRALTEQVAADALAMIAAGRTPAPVFEKAKCRACSLLELCRPTAIGKARAVSSWLKQQIDE